MPLNRVLQADLIVSHRDGNQLGDLRDRRQKLDGIPSHEKYTANNGESKRICGGFRSVVFYRLYLDFTAFERNKKVTRETNPAIAIELTC